MPGASRHFFGFLSGACRCARPVHRSPRPRGIGTQIAGLANERPMPGIATAEMRMTGLRDEKKPSSSSRISPLRLGQLQLRVAVTQRDPGHQRAA
jgi:hypothetical protein